VGTQAPCWEWLGIAWPSTGCCLRQPHLLPPLTTLCCTHTQYAGESSDEGLLDDVGRGLRQYMQAQGADCRAEFFSCTLPFVGELAVRASLPTLPIGLSGVAARCRPAVALPLRLTEVGAGRGRVSGFFSTRRVLPCAAFELPRPKAEGGLGRELIRSHFHVSATLAPPLARTLYDSSRETMGRKFYFHGKSSGVSL